MGFAVPIALSPDGRAVHWAEGAKIAGLVCPGCRAPVVWRECSPEDRRSHFAHVGEGGGGDGGCSAESAIHAGAKLVIADWIRASRRGESRAPVLLWQCIKCKDHVCARGATWKPERVSVEERVGAFVPDVYLDPDKIALEVCYKHPIPDDKIAGLKSAGVRWVELRAEPILEDPPRLEVLRASHMREELCPACAATTSDAAVAAMKKARDAWKAAEESRKEAASYAAKLDELERRRGEAEEAVARLEALRADGGTVLLVLEREAEALRAEKASLAERLRADAVAFRANLSKETAEARERHARIVRDAEEAEEKLARANARLSHVNARSASIVSDVAKWAKCSAHDLRRALDWLAAEREAG